ncbi:hypothetical protein SMC26_16915 [Actinomadura fulvescens]|uniref:Bulb-type lectin domain-containing protein n=1 Tax=Actinomadura fulvescens TaxID=46160 RepID=A0ABN3Q9Y7_9ACTN
MNKLRLAAVAMTTGVVVAPLVVGTTAHAETTSAPTAQATRAVGDLLKPGQTLKAGKFRKSRNGKYRLIQQQDGNLVLYKGRRALWSSLTAGHKGAFAIMQKDGNLVVYKGRKALWASNTGRSHGAFLAVQNDGNLVIYKGRKAIWSRHMYIGTLVAPQRLNAGQYVVSPNRKYRFVQQLDGNLVLYKGRTALWSNRQAGRPGAYTVMQKDGNLVTYRGRTALWSTRTGGKWGAFLAVQNDGNVVVYKGRTPLWWTGTTG